MRACIVFALTLAFAASCSKSSAPPDETPEPSTAPAAPAETVDPVAKAHEIFSQRCVPCHGSTGQGDGPASASLNPKPRKYADHDWQASVTDDYIEKIIKMGGAAVGKSPAMPNNPDLNNSPAVVAGLKDIVRSFDKK